MLNSAHRQLRFEGYFNFEQFILGIWWPRYVNLKEKQIALTITIYLFVFNFRISYIRRLTAEEEIKLFTET